MGGSGPSLCGGETRCPHRQPIRRGPLPTEALEPAWRRGVQALEGVPERSFEEGSGQAGLLHAWDAPDLFSESSLLWLGVGGGQGGAGLGAAPGL